jgi:hypothetical protein
MRFGAHTPGRLLRLPHGDGALHALLGVLVLLVFAGAPLAQFGLLPPRLQAALLAATVLLGLLALGSPTRLAWPLLVTAGLAVLMLGADALEGAPEVLLLAAGTTALALAVLAAALLRQVLGPGRVTIARIEGALALYLLIALVFAKLYTMIELELPGAFAMDDPPADPLTLDRRLTYFSIITQTSTGYGDIAPRHALARSLAALQALGGQVFTAVLLARLVALELTHRGER